MQNFNKNDYVVGNTVYLLFIGGYGTEKKDPEQVIFEAVVKAVGRKYITVLKGTREIRFEYDKETESIWQKYDYGRDYEIYTTKEKALEALNKKKLKKDIYNIASGMLCTHFDRNSIDQLELLKAIMVGTLTDYKKEKLSDILMRLLPSMEKDTFYRKIWAEDVMRDIKSFAADKGIRLSDENIKEAAEAYVNGRYDCNLSYWENLHNLIQESKEKGLEYIICLQSLFDALTGCDPEEDYVPLEVEGYIQKETEGDKVYYNLKTDDGTPCMDREICQVMDITPDYVVLMEEDTRIPFKLSRKEFDLAVIPYTEEGD